jgi:hypothetical protein
LKVTDEVSRIRIHTKFHRSATLVFGTVLKNALRLHTVQRKLFSVQRLNVPFSCFFFLKQFLLPIQYIKNIFFFKLCLCWAGPRPPIPFPPDLIFVCKFSRHGSSSPVTSHLAPSITVLVFPDSADAYSRTTASYRLTQLFSPNTRE